MAMIREDRPYAGILMKDGTEISHYGVKGMKWGKKLFGKVKGVFGIPSGPQTKTLYKSKTGKIEADMKPRKPRAETKNTSQTAERRKGTPVRTGKTWTVERDEDGHPFYSLSGNGKRKNQKQQTKKK